MHICQILFLYPFTNATELVKKITKKLLYQNSNNKIRNQKPEKLTRLIPDYRKKQDDSESKEWFNETIHGSAIYRTIAQPGSLIPSPSPSPHTQNAPVHRHGWFSLSLAHLSLFLLRSSRRLYPAPVSQRRRLYARRFVLYHPIMTLINVTIKSTDADLLSVVTLSAKGVKW